jgi:hypothetical protein
MVQLVYTAPATMTLLLCALRTILLGYAAHLPAPVWQAWRIRDTTGGFNICWAAFL